MQPDSLRKVYLEITTDCNFACQMCVRHVWQEAVATMTGETFGRLIAQLRAIAGLEVVSFGGFGEATVHPELLNFLAAIKQAGFRTELITNSALLSGKLAEGFLELGLDRLVVSIDAVEPTADPTFHGPADAARAVQANLRAFAQMQRARRTLQPTVGVQFVATRRNIHELPALRSMAREWGFSSILVTNLVPHQPELQEDILYRRWTTARRSRGTSPWNPVVDLPRMDVRSAASQAIDTLHARGAHLRILGQELAGGGMRCRFVEEGCVAIGPDGRVSPCLPLLHTHSYYYEGQRRQVRQYHLGNVNVTPLGDLWQSNAYRAFRERVRRFEFSPCVDCGGCDLRLSNQADCAGDEAPRCGACLWAAGIVQCP